MAENTPKIPPKILFEEVKDKDGKVLHHVANIKLHIKKKGEEEESAYLRLLDLFFRPEKTLGKEQFDKIFPPNPDYIIEEHKDIPLYKEFLPWNGWLFRGQSKENYRLQTTFERLCYNGLQSEDNLFKKEMGMIREFQRKIRTYHPESASIDNNDLYEYMAMMQHYGCATRFLDVSFSFFVALFFAIWRSDFDTAYTELPILQGQKKLPDDTVGKWTAEAVRKRMFKKKRIGTCSLWCFNRMWIEHIYKEMLPAHIWWLYKNYDMFGKDTRIQDAVLNYVPELKKSGRPYRDEFLSVINMTPYYMNSRMIKQRGSFLVPTNPYRSFEENLFAMVRPETDDSWRILKINIEYDNETLLYLRKFLDEMNINNAVLFEGIGDMCNDVNFKANIAGDAITVSPNADTGHK